MVAHRSGRRRVLHYHTEKVLLRQPGVQVRDQDLDPDCLAPGTHDGEGLRQAVGVDHQRAAAVLASAAHQRDRLGHGGGLVEQ